MAQFTKADLSAILGALTVQRKSVQRLAAKEGQPESVANEYRKVDVELSRVMDKVTREYASMEKEKPSA